MGADDVTGMATEIKLSRIEGEFEDRTYPASRSDLAETYAGTTLLFADGEADLGALIEEVDQERFESASDLFDALQNVLPVEAVGEPGQSEGEG